MLARAQIPNALTMARVAAVPLCLALILLAPDARVLLFVVFVAASITDYLDGYLARKWQVTSRLGALLDPIADKLLVALMLLYLCVLNIADFLPVSIILLRELYIAGLREFLGKLQVDLPVSRGGKWKTALQMLAVAVLLAQDAFGAALPETSIGATLLYASALLAFISAVSYTRASWVYLR